MSREAGRPLAEFGCADVSLWGRLFAAVYDRAMAPVEEKGMAERRRRLLAGLEGRVVELGAGTGANLAAYGPDVAALVLCEPEEPMARRLERRLAESGRPGRVLRAPAEALPLEDGAADAVVATLVLCTVSDVGRALAEVRRVLKPGAPLVFVEHVRADDPGLARWQDRFTPLQKRIGHGCHPNRDTLAALTRAGFAVADLERGRLNGAPPVLRPLIAGRALSPA